MTPALPKDFPESCFPADYRQARRNFIAAATAAGLGTITRVHPRAKGPDGQPLFLDSTALGPRDARRALLLIAGTHGVEGYFGAGVQTGLLRAGLHPPAGMRVVLVHALNPYGFAWDRRVNEDNIDINRNFVDFAAPPANPEYARLADAIAPRDLTRLAETNRRLLDYAAAHGVARLQEVVSRGQYAFADGLWYGGRAACWSHRMLQAILGEDLPRVERLTVIDFHTGLGSYGAVQMITEARPGEAAHDRARALWGDRVASSQAGDSLSAPLEGTLDRAVAAWLPGAECTFAALEVGTVPLTQAFEALRHDNWLHCFAADKSTAPAIARACRDAFYPDRADWKRLAFAQARQAVRAALK